MDVQLLVLIVRKFTRRTHLEHRVAVLADVQLKVTAHGAHNVKAGCQAEANIVALGSIVDTLSVTDFLERTEQHALLFWSDSVTRIDDLRL